MSYLSTGRDLLSFTLSDEPWEERRAAVIVADPDFDWRPGGTRVSSRRANISAAGRVLPLPIDGSCATGPFIPLPYSGKEISGVTDLLGQHPVTVTTCIDTAASERSLKQLPEPPWLLHLATHGFYCRDSTMPHVSSMLRALLGSGLALAGANTRRSSASASDSLGEDGILTALEVSALNLLGTELTVLSACESGIGTIVDGEGVFGLRRAFHHAGSRSVLMNLWRAPDRPSAQLILRFYEHWLSGLGKRDALRAATLETLNELRATRGTAHPMLWGGFILAGDPN
ncbi:CHAT domain-containing protein [candidate division GN15 bacterium]|nr:CHAT domain-containing protein [candidate division GN15 bacterium]